MQRNQLDRFPTALYWWLDQNLEWVFYLIYSSKRPSVQEKSVGLFAMRRIPVVFAVAALNAGPLLADQNLETYLGNQHDAGQYAYHGEAPSEVEISLYKRQSPAPCEGPHAHQAVNVALSSHWEWVERFQTKGAADKSTRRAFDDAWQALRYLVEDLNCEDPLIGYRYGNSIHMQRDYERSVVELGKVVAEIEKHYPQMLPIAQSQYAEALGLTGSLDEAIKQHRQVLKRIPDSVSAALNLANRLSQRLDPGDSEEARDLLAKARSLGVSNYRQNVIDEIETRLER